MILDDKLYEHVNFRGWFYGRTKEDFYSGNLVIMTPAGIEQMPDNDIDESYIIYLDIDEEIRRERLSERNDIDGIERRVKADDLDFKHFNKFDYRITNPNFTAAQVQMLIDKLKQSYTTQYNNKTN